MGVAAADDDDDDDADWCTPIAGVEEEEAEAGDHNNETGGKAPTIEESDSLECQCW